MISATYALGCLATCIFAVIVAKGKNPEMSARETEYQDSVEVKKNKDDTSQSLTTYYPEPTGNSKNL
jgi:hypothetical protein